MINSLGFVDPNVLLSTPNKKRGGRRGKAKQTLLPWNVDQKKTFTRLAQIKNDVAKLNSVVTRIQGRGDYTVSESPRKPRRRGYYGSRVGNMLGRMAAPYLGIDKATGSQIGRNLGMKFSQVTGWGDYEVSENTLLKNTPIPSFGPESIRVYHKEYLGNILGSTEFQSQIYRLNPGISDSFPWLAGIARNYQQYRINGMMFQFISTSAFALASTNSSLGKVVIATNYNAEDEQFTSSVAMLSTQFSNYGRPAESLSHAIECAPSQTPDSILYIRTDIDQKDKDLRLTDLGFTQVATEGMQTDSEVGGLWITYDVTFLKPIINSGVSIDIGLDQFVMVTQPESLYENATIIVRNGKLQGGLTMETKQAVYRFNQGISTGFYYFLVEYLPGNDCKLQYDNNNIGKVNCELVVDIDGNGPFQEAGIGSPGYLDTLADPGVAIQQPVCRMFMIKVTGPRAIVTIQGASVTAGSASMTWRLTVIPLSYSQVPDVSSAVIPTP